MIRCKISGKILEPSAHPGALIFQPLIIFVGKITGWW